MVREERIRYYEAAMNEGYTGLESAFRQVAPSACLTVADSHQQVIYPSQSLSEFIDVPIEAVLFQASYQESDGSLFIRFNGLGDQRIFALISGISENEATAIVDEIDCLDFAISHLLSRGIGTRAERKPPRLYLKSRELKFSELEDYANEYLNAHDSYVVHVMACEENNSGKSIEQLYDLEYAFVSNMDTNTVVLGFKNCFVYLIDAEGEAGIFEERFAWKREYFDSFEARYDLRTSNTWSEPHSLDEIRLAYSEAVALLKLFQMKGAKNFKEHCAANPFIPYLASTPHIVRSCENLLRQALQKKGNAKETGLTTLVSLVDSDFDYSVAAEKLCCHVNTVRYRAKNLEAAFGLDFDDHEDLAKVITMVHVLRLGIYLRLFE